MIHTVKGFGIVNKAEIYIFLALSAVAPDLRHGVAHLGRCPSEAQAGITIARRNINNLRYADDTTFMAEIEEELKSLLMKVKEEWGRSWEGGSGLGIHVHLWWIHVNVWQNKYSIVK